MPDKIIAAMGETGWIAWFLALLGMVGTFARHLVRKEPFDLRRCAGEALLSAIGALMLWALGMMQGMTVFQMLFFGSLTALGGLRSVEWLIRAFFSIKDRGVV